MPQFEFNEIERTTASPSPSLLIWSFFTDKHRLYDK